MGYSGVQSNLMSVPPYLFGALGLYMFAFSSDRLYPPTVLRRANLIAKNVATILWDVLESLLLDLSSSALSRPLLLDTSAFASCSSVRMRRHLSPSSGSPVTLLHRVNELWSWASTDGVTWLELLEVNCSAQVMLRATCLHSMPRWGLLS